MKMLTLVGTVPFPVTIAALSTARATMTDPANAKKDGMEQLAIGDATAFELTAPLRLIAKRARQVAKMVSHLLYQMEELKSRLTGTANVMVLAGAVTTRGDSSGLGKIALQPASRAVTAFANSMVPANATTVGAGRHAPYGNTPTACLVTTSTGLVRPMERAFVMWVIQDLTALYHAYHASMAYAKLMVHVSAVKAMQVMTVALASARALYHQTLLFPTKVGAGTTTAVEEYGRKS